MHLNVFVISRHDDHLRIYGSKWNWRMAGHNDDYMLTVDDGGDNDDFQKPTSNAQVFRSMLRWMLTAHANHKKKRLLRKFVVDLIICNVSVFVL